MSLQRAIILALLAAGAFTGAARAQDARDEESPPDPPVAEPGAATEGAAPAAEATSEGEPDPAAGEPVAEPERAEDAMASPVEGEPPTDDASGWGSLADIASPEARTFETRFYGYVDSYFGISADSPTGGVNPDGSNEFETNDAEWDVLNLHLMVQGSILERYRFFVNLAARSSGDPGFDELLGVRNAWVEVPLVGNQLVVRAGKTYRRFGLYNEILDAVPTFIGVEPPELFDFDHLMLTRTTNLMIHGAFDLGSEISLQYSVTTGADEAISGAVPVGGDLRVDFGTWLRLGASGYWTGGDAGPTRGVGEGSPRGGVANWMASDEYWVAGLYAQLSLEGLILQAEYWHAEHDARRDPEATMQLADAGLSATQMARFFVSGEPSMGVREVARYGVDTFYLRAGYRIAIDEQLALTPYAQLDWYSNPETIREKDFGGDNEAGISDDGEFWKVTLGAVLRPIPQVALKVDGSVHVQTVNAQTEFYPEARVSFSYLWELEL